MTRIEPADRGANPFDHRGVEVGADGIRRYRDRPPSLVAMLRRGVDARPDATAVVELGGPRLTYRELWDAAARVAGGLAELGVGRGDRVAIRLPNGAAWIVAFWGVQLAGAVAVPVNVRLADPEVAYLIEDSGAVLALDIEHGLPDGDAHVVEDRAPDDVAAIFYTSGTTGDPKGAMMSHANFLANSESAVRLLGIDREEGPSLSTLVSVPLFHVTGCNSQMIPLLDLGGRVEVLRQALDLDGILTAIVEHRVNHLVSVPAVYHALLRHPDTARSDLGSVRWVLYGGAPIDVAMVRRIQAGFPAARVGNGFGLTESSSLVSFLPHEAAADHPTSVGWAMPVVDIAIDAPDPTSGVGELLVRGPNVVRGYWRKPRETEATFLDGWLRTGDVGRIDDEGRLYIVDRIKDIINRGGENVHSIEVENALAGAPGVGEAAALAVPDTMMGEKVGAVLVPLPGRELDVEAVLEHVRGQLADFKVPQYVVVRDRPLPRNAGGKVRKPQLRAQTTWGAPLR